MIGYEMEWSGLDEQIRRLGDYDNLANRELHDAMDSSVRFIGGLAVRNAPRDRGDLAGSEQHEVQLVAGELTGRVEFTDFKALWLEFGVGPHWPPERAIMERIGVDPKHAHFIAEKIGRRGIKGRFFLWKAANRGLSFVNRRFEEALEKLAERLSV